MFIRYTPKQLSFLKNVLPSVNLKAFQIGIYNEILKALEHPIDEKDVGQLVDRLKKEEQMELYHKLKNMIEPQQQTVKESSSAPSNVSKNDAVEEEIKKVKTEISNLTQPVNKVKKEEPPKEEPKEVDLSNKVDEFEEEPKGKCISNDEIENIEESIDNTIEETNDIERIEETSNEIEETDEKIEEESSSTGESIEESTEYKVYDGSEDDDDCIFGTIDKRQNNQVIQNLKKEQSKYI